MSTFETCVLTVFSDTTRARAISRLERPWAICTSTSRSRSVSSAMPWSPPVGRSPPMTAAAASGANSTFPSRTALIAWTSAGVPQRVVHRFLGDPEQHELAVLGERDVAAAVEGQSCVEYPVEHLDVLA